MIVGFDTHKPIFEGAFVHWSAESSFDLARITCFYFNMKNQGPVFGFIISRPYAKRCKSTNSFIIIYVRLYIMMATNEALEGACLL